MGTLRIAGLTLENALTESVFQNGNAQLNAMLEAKEAREAAERYLAPYLFETGNFLEYQRGMSL